MSERRPVHLDLLRIRQPLPAVVSILHRMAGALLFLLLPVVLYGLDRSLAREDAFLALKEGFLPRLLSWLVLALFAFHGLAGLRLLLFDLHRPGWYRHARSSALAVLVVAAVSALVLGIALW